MSLLTETAVLDVATVTTFIATLDDAQSLESIAAAVAQRKEALALSVRINSDIRTKGYALVVYHHSRYVPAHLNSLRLYVLIDLYAYGDCEPLDWQRSGLSDIQPPWFDLLDREAIIGFNAMEDPYYDDDMPSRSHDPARMKGKIEVHLCYPDLDEDLENTLQNIRMINDEGVIEFFHRDDGGVLRSTDTGLEAPPGSLWGFVVPPTLEPKTRRRVWHKFEDMWEGDECDCKLCDMSWTSCSRKRKQDEISD